MLDFQTIFSNSPAPMCIVAEKGYTVTAANEALCALFGYTMGELLGLNMLDNLGHSEDKEESLKWINSGEFSYSLEKRYVRKDGDIFWARAKVIRDNSEFFVIFDDISTLKELERLYKMLANDFNSFAYTASHDLLEPLRSVKNYTDQLSLLYNGFSDNEQAQEAYRIIDSNLILVKRQVDALLSYSRLGTRKIEKKLIPLDKVVEKCTYALRSLIDEKKGQIIIDCSGFIYADELHLVKLFQNLIQNSLKYSEQPIIKIGCKNQLFWVSDNGIGIDKKYFEVIFKLFKRIPSPQDGIGIGLTEVKRVVELYGGKIWLESEIGKGTTFYFTLPKA